MSDPEHAGKRYQVTSKDGTDFDVWYISSSKPFSGETGRPVIIHIHGGGFITGGFVGDFNPALFRLKQLPPDFLHVTDFCLLSVQYRLAPKNPFPKALEDAYATILWAHRLAHELNIDTNRIYVLGISAGGGLGMSLVAKARDEKLSPPLRGFMAIYPMLDPKSQSKWSLWLKQWRKWHDIYFLNWAWHAYLGGSEQNSDGERKYAVPILQNLEGFPPTYLDVGTKDLFFEEVKQLDAKFRETDVDFQVQYWENMDHDFESSKLEAVQKVVKEAQNARMAWIDSLPL